LNTFPKSSLAVSMLLSKHSLFSDPAVMRSLRHTSMCNMGMATREPKPCTSHPNELNDKRRDHISGNQQHKLTNHRSYQKDNYIC